MLHKRKSRRQHLIEVGMQLFSERSYEGVAIDDIAEAADISKGLLYYYYPTKHDFYVAVIRYAADQLLAVTEPDLSLEPLERLRVALLTYFTYVERHARAYVALLRGGVGADAEVAAIIDSVRQTYVRRVLQSLPEGEQPTPLLHIAITGWVGFVETTSLAWLEQPGLDKTQLCKLAVRVLLAALQGVRESSSGLAGATGEARS